MIDYSSCPACGGKRFLKTDKVQVHRCKRCGAIFGSLYLGDSYTFVLPWFAQAEVPAEQTRYFDFTCLGSEGITRRHGWYDTESRRIVQVG